MSISLDDLKRELLTLVQNAVKDTGHEFKATAASFQTYVALRAPVLQAALNQPGFGEALKAETDNLLMEATEDLFDQADLADVKVWSVVNGAFNALIRVLA